MLEVVNEPGIPIHYAQYIGDADRFHLLEEGLFTGCFLLAVGGRQ